MKYYKGSFFLLVLLAVFIFFGDLGFAENLNEAVQHENSSDMMLLIIYVLLALGFSFLCSISEATLLSITPSYIEGLKIDKPKQAYRLQRLKLDDVDQSLAAILTLNTIANTVGAIGAGSKATIVFGSVWFGVFSAVMTLMILFFSEIIPKTIGAVYWNRLAVPVSIFVNVLIRILYPIVWISDKLTKIISSKKDMSIFSRDEFIAMASIGVQSGQLQTNESTIINNLLRFESLSVHDIMTPRTVVSALPEDLKICDSLKQIADTSFSRIPLYQGSLDKVTGFILKNDILVYTSQNRGDEKLEILKRDIIVVSEFVTLTYLFERFLREKQHVALVVDEYGVTCGIVTLEDLIETLTGIEIIDETDAVVDMRALAREQWSKRAKAMGIDPESPLEKDNDS